MIDCVIVNRTKLKKFEDASERTRKSMIKSNGTMVTFKLVWIELLLEPTYLPYSKLGYW